ncbi:MAG: outer membrane beta-barrel protein [Tannerella sp.]|jgi:hypothetical protein|nr:outer membrane beta-barrel protein [Tannerella sp.]
MNKYLIVLAMITVYVIAGNAQESSMESAKGGLSLEVGFSPLDVEGNNIQLQNEQLRLIYSVSDKIGIRLGIGFNTSTESDDNGLPSDEWMETTSKTSRIAFSPGIIYSFAGTEKLMPYLGAEAIIAAKSATTIAEAKDFKQEIRNEGDLFNTFGLGVFSGFNYYFAERLYIGAEVGLAFEYKSLKNTIIETTTGGRTETVEPKNTGTRTTLGTVVTPSLRLGWRF